MDAFQLVGSLISMNSGGSLPKFTLYDLNVGSPEYAASQVDTHSIYIAQVQLTGGNTAVTAYQIINANGQDIQFPYAVLLTVPGTTMTSAASIFMHLNSAIAYVKAGAPVTAGTLLASGLIGVD